MSFTVRNYDVACPSCGSAAGLPCLPHDGAGGERVPFNISTKYGTATHQGIVRLQFGEFAISIPYAEARLLGLMLVEASTRAEGDHMLMRLLTDAMAVPESVAAGLLHLMRIYRATGAFPPPDEIERSQG